MNEFLIDLPGWRNADRNSKNWSIGIDTVEVRMWSSQIKLHYSWVVNLARVTASNFFNQDIEYNSVNLLKLTNQIYSHWLQGSFTVTVITLQEEHLLLTGPQIGCQWIQSKFLSRARLKNPHKQPFWTT